MIKRARIMDAGFTSHARLLSGECQNVKPDPWTLHMTPALIIGQSYHIRAGNNSLKPLAINSIDIAAKINPIILVKTFILV